MFIQKQIVHDIKWIQATQVIKVSGASLFSISEVARMHAFKSTCRYKASVQGSLLLPKKGFFFYKSSYLRFEFFISIQN